MAQINHSISDEMTAQEKSVLNIKPGQQSAKLVNSGERALAGEAPFCACFRQCWGSAHEGNHPHTLQPKHIKILHIAEKILKSALCLKGA